MCTIACYDKAVKEQADVMEGQYVPSTFLPFEEANTNPTLAAFLKYVGKANANGFASLRSGPRPSVQAGGRTRS